jgi:peptide chain release factor subunit 1
MITRQDIERLEAFDGQGARVLSVYLDLDPERQVRRSYQTVFKDLVKDIAEALDARDEQAHRQLHQEAARVQEWLEAEAPRGKSVAIFSCTPGGLWQTHFLPVPLKDQAAFEPAPYLQPLLDLLDEYERYAVALVDKEKARLFTVFLGEIEEHQVDEEVVPGKHKQGGWSQARYQRHHEAHVYWHLKRVADLLARMYRRRRFDRLILAGPEEATSELRRLLPRALAHRLVGTFPAELFASDAEILRQTLDIERQVERGAEERLLAELFDLAGSAGRATYGVEPTLEALWLGEVQKLVVAEGLRAGGSECPGCGRLTVASLAECPACGAAMRAVEDVIERAAERALDQAGSVEVVHGEAAQRLLDEAEGMGAFLRYR